MNAKNRIIALDMLRGYALVVIMVDHMPIGVLRGYTLGRFAVFDAAELFVLLSGFLVGLVWLNVERSQGRRAAQIRFLRRAVQVWLALVVGSVLMALLSRGLFEAGMNHTAIWSQYARWVVEYPIGYLVTIGTLWMQPNLIDVLALYVVMLVLTPLSVPLMLRNPWIFAAGSVALWAVSVPLNEMIPNHRSEGGMLFNPFAWQMLFHSGVAMGLFRTRFMPVLRRHATPITVVMLAIGLSMAVLSQLWRFGPDGQVLMEQIKEAIGPVDKWSLDSIRYISIIAAAWLVAVPFARPMEWLAGTWLGRSLAVIGRGGLISFVACVMLSVLGDALMMMDGASQFSYRLSVDIWTVVALWLVAEIAARQSRKRRVAQPG
ncbi:hypothetical protein SAMN05421538_11357 [Paracoccus isoporae]|uniref:OpgC protein n=1 Tax=Paracoccus isoporae TaxID=591205 RepID=A0A1G7GHY2_9RHOB|nr:OpgC domain-containing protein [Paracoccus isoporae]SDE87736.1 hypothetical protein SAMN05421538_11357 [Paracoccus isoporae]